MNRYLLIFLIFLISGVPVGAQSVQPVEPTNVAIRQRQANVCAPDYVGESLSFTMSMPLSLESLVDQIHRRFGVNFLLGDKVKDLTINIKSGSLPWNTLLDSQLYLSGVSKKCINNNTLMLVKNEERKKLDDEQKDVVEIKTEFIKLKYLQPTTTTTQDVAGRSQQGGNGGGGGQGCQSGQGGGGGGQSGGGSGGGNGNQGCGNFEKLIFEIEKILGLRAAQNNGLTRSDNVTYRDGSRTNDAGSIDADSVPIINEQKARGSLAVIPGRNILVIQGTDEQLNLIKQFIALADRPPFQVIIRGLVYTANVDRLRDIGVQTTIVAGTADGRTTGTIIGNPISGAGSIFDFSTLIGTVDFNVQASALQQNGVISIKARPFAVVLDGSPTELEVGRQIPVLTQGSVVGGDAGNLEFIGASNLLSVTPHVMDDDNGNPIAVNLEMQIESNEVDTAITSQGVPAVNRRSIQSRLILSQDKTVILGGFTVDSVNDSTSKTPGLGDIPILGYLFKRKVRQDQVNRLYFAISVSVVPYGDVIEPVKVPGATTEIPGVRPVVIKREENLEKRNQ